MEQPPSPDSAKEIEEQKKSRTLVDAAVEELNNVPSKEPKRREIDERWPDNVPVWKPDAAGDLKKVA